MEFWENLGAKISQAEPCASQRFNKRPGIPALNSPISKLESSLTELYCSLGAKYYSACGSDPHPEFETFCESIAQVKEQIASIAQSKGCAKCGAPVPSDEPVSTP